VAHPDECKKDAFDYHMAGQDSNPTKGMKVDVSQSMVDQCREN
jgi:hypothetical protein